MKRNTPNLADRIKEAEPPTIRFQTERENETALYFKYPARVIKEGQGTIAKWWVT